MSRELLFSVTASDCDWQYIRGTGPGGQKRNKTETKVRCVHRASGAVGESDLTRSQAQNKQIAFRKMAESSQFKIWHKLETARRLGDKMTLEEKVESAMKESNLKIEGKVDGKWTKLDVLEKEE